MMHQHCITLDERSEELLEKLVPGIYPSRSELFRELIRKEYGRLQERRMIE